MATGRHRRGEANPDDASRTGEASRSAVGSDDDRLAPDALDPDRLPVDEDEMSAEEDNRDLGAALEDEGIPEAADDSTPGTGEVPEPERPIVPTDEPTGSEAYGTTAREEADRDRLENHLAAEEPEETEEWAAEKRASDEFSERPDVGGPGIHVEEEGP